MDNSTFEIFSYVDPSAKVLPIIPEAKWSSPLHRGSMEALIKGMSIIG